MRGDVVFRVYGVHEGREQDSYFGTFRTTREAKERIAELLAKEMDGRNWAQQHHNRGFAIREFKVDTDFEIPPRPKPRDRYFIKLSDKPNRPGTWNSTLVEVLRRDGPAGDFERIGRYERNYFNMYMTFEPFRQGNREFALISRHYTRTAVLDLASGEVVAEETEDRPGSGFCPVGFYVPDWLDLHDESVIPGSEYWNEDYEWPTGKFGFVWRCYWGDDSSWKIQYLDLSDIQRGVIRRDDRFGYVEIASGSYDRPIQPSQGVSNASALPHFIRIWKNKDKVRVVFDVVMGFDLASGKAEEWQRLRIANFE